LNWLQEKSKLVAAARLNVVFKKFVIENYVLIRFYL